MSNDSTKNDRILLIDDDAKFCGLMKNYLGMHNFVLSSVHAGQDGLDTLGEQSFDLVLLDMFLPDINGLEVLKAIRTRSRVPVIILSAHNEETDRILALEIGADDYVPKIFSSRELLARIKAVLRRHIPQPDPDPDTLTLRGLSLNRRTTEAWLDGQLLNLTGFEFDLLHAMTAEAGRVFSREDLLSLIADRDMNKFDRSVDVHISALRAKLNDDSHSPQYIRTLRGRGYCIIR